MVKKQQEQFDSDKTRREKLRFLAAMIQHVESETYSHYPRLDLVEIHALSAEVHEFLIGKFKETLGESDAA